jgi:starch phosphorylase
MAAMKRCARLEMVLGVGVMALRARCEPAVFHMNEGHSAFGFGAARVSQQGPSFDQASEVVRKSSVFTTHTPVPAGHVPSLPHDGPHFKWHEDLKISHEEF